MKITSRNVNGIRAVMNKDFLTWMEADGADILCLQEVKSFEHQMPPELRFALEKGEYAYIWHTGERAGYAGTAIFYKKKLGLLSGLSTFGEPHLDTDGRVTQAEFSDFVLLNVYFPNGGTRADGTEMLTFKLAFYDAMMVHCDALLAAGKQVIITGDFNICHTEQDIARPEANQNSIGFLPVERAKIGEFFTHGYIDMFRKFTPEGNGHYTWRSYRAGARPRNVGRRLDYFAVSETLASQIKKMTHHTEVMGSDHCPISIEW